MAGLTAATLAEGADTNEWPLEVWHDPAFRRQFLGSYGTRAEIEPRVTPLEREQLEQALLLMPQKGGDERARKLLEPLAKTPGATALFDFTIGNVHFQHERLELAAAWYRRAADKFPSYLRAHKNLGVVAMRLGQFDKAAPALTRALELGENDGLTYGLLGFAYLQTDRPLPAESAYRQAMLLQPDTTDWQTGLARSLFKQGRYEEAATLCQTLIARAPDRPEYWILQANAYLGMKQPVKAAENFEYLALAGQSSAQSLNTLGDIYVNENLPDLAADAYRRALDKGGDGSLARALRNAEVLAARGASAEARTLATALKTQAGANGLPADDKRRLLKLEARLAATGAGGGEQMRLLEELVALDPLDGEALIMLGRHQAGAGLTEKAAFCFERAAGLSRFEAEARLRHAQCLVKAGRYQEAVPLLKRAQELRPRDDVARYLEQVERVARTRG